MTEPTRPAHPVHRLRCLTGDPVAIEALRPALASRGLALEIRAEPEQALASRPGDEPTWLLLDTGILRGLADPEPLLDACREAYGDPPRLIGLDRGDDLRPRLAVLRAGALGCLRMDTPDPETLAERLRILVDSARTDQARILIMEDQPVAALFAARILEGAGMRTLRVGDPLQIIPALEAFAPDLVLMDLHMPGVTGIELTSILRDQGRFDGLPIVFLSGEPDPDRQLDALRVGGNDFLAKPVRPERLLASVRDQLRRSRARRLAPPPSPASAPAARQSGPCADGYARALFDRPPPDAAFQSGSSPDGFATGSVVAADRGGRPTGVADGEAAILGALRERRLRLLFEPILDLGRRPEARYEVKPRLLSAGDELSPGEFLPLARPAGLTGLLDHWLLEQTLDVLRSCREASQRVRFFVHQSLETAAADDWIERLREEIERRDLIRLRPVIQFEAAEVESQGALALERAQALARLGLPLCLNGIDTDDIGQRALAILPAAAFARIGRRAVRRLSLEALKTLIREVRALGPRVIATGVDGPDTVARLFGTGADLLQGSFVHPPMEAPGFDFASTRPPSDGGGEDG